MSLKKEARERERCTDKDKLRLHLMNTISISHLFFHMRRSSSPPAFLRSPVPEKALHLTSFLLPSSAQFRLVPNLETLNHVRFPSGVLVFAP